jgi:hypothetical protein
MWKFSDALGDISYRFGGMRGEPLRSRGVTCITLISPPAWGHF